MQSLMVMFNFSDSDFLIEITLFRQIWSKKSKFSVKTKMQYLEYFEYVEFNGNAQFICFSQ